MEVAVIMCVFNGEKYLKESIESALMISQVSELIIVDDCSTDSSILIINEIASKNDRIFIVRNDVNKGLAASRNIGIKRSKSEFIAFLDADDWYLPHRFNTHLNILKNNPKVFGVYSPTFLYSDSFGEIFGKYGSSIDIISLEDKSLEPFEYFKLILENQWSLFNNIGITVRRSCFFNFGWFDEKLRLHQDTELWWRFFRVGIFLGQDFDNPVGVVRIHEGNNSKNKGLNSKRLMFSRYCLNVGINNMYRFEVEFLFKSILRLESSRFRNNSVRRIIFYFFFLIYSLNKKKMLFEYAQKYG